MSKQNFLSIVGDTEQRKGYAGFGNIQYKNIVQRVTIDGNIKLLGTSSVSGSSNRIYNHNYFSDYFGTGYALQQRQDGSHLEVDNITIRNSLYASIFQIDTIRASNGYLFISDCAEVAFPLTVTATGSIYTLITNNNTFQLGDLVWYKAKYANGVLGVKGQILSQASQIESNENQKPSYAYQFKSIYGTGTLQSGKTIVRVGNTSNAARQGAIFFSANGDNTPFMDIYDGVNTFSGSSTSSFASNDKLKLRLGDLNGVTDDELIPVGYGLYSQNVFLKGSIIANKGKIGNWFIQDGNLYTPNANNTKIFIGVGEYNDTNSSFYVDSTGKFSLKDKLTFDGNTLSIKGKIQSYQGKIANWSITQNSLMSNQTQINSLQQYIKFSDQIYIGKKQDKYILQIGNDQNFIKYDGKDLTISSYINAKGGFLGQWEITQTDIVSNNFRLDASKQQLLIGNILGFKTGSGIFMGRDFNSAPDQLDQFLVSSGSDYLSISGGTASAYSYADYKLFIGQDQGNNFLYDGRNIQLTGKITTTRGLIGCWNIDETSIYSGSNSFNNLNSIYFGSQGLSLSNKFIVSNQGSLTASSANINGIISSISGSIGGWNINETGISKNNTSIKSATSSYFGQSIGITASTTFTVHPETKSINIKQKNAGDSDRTVLYDEDKIQSVQNITGVVSVQIQYVINTTSQDGTYASGIYLQLFTDETDEKRYKLFGSNQTRSLSVLFQTTNTNKLQIRALAQGVPDFLSSNFDVLNITKVSIGIFDSKVQLSESGLLLFNNPANYIRFGYKNDNQIAQIKTGQLQVKNLVVYQNLYHHGQTFNVASDLFGTSADRFVINTQFDSVSPYLQLRGQYNSAKITYTDNLTWENAKIDIDKTVFISNHQVLTENSDINANKVKSVDGSKLPLSVIPKGALEQLHTVQTEEARLLVTKFGTGSGVVNAQNGDTIRVVSSHKMYFVINEDDLSPDGVIPGSQSAFSQYVASTHWDVIMEKPFSWNLKTNGATQSVDFNDVVTFTGNNGITVTNSGRIININGTTYTSSNPISLSGTTFGLNYNSSNLKITSNALNTIQDIGTSSNVEFGGVKVNNVNVVTENRSVTLSAGNQINISGNPSQTLANNLNWAISHAAIPTTTASVTSSSYFVSDITYNNGHITQIAKSPLNISHTHSINNMSFGIGQNINIVTALNSILSISSSNKTITLDVNPKTLNFGEGLIAGSYNAKSNVTVSHKAVQTGSFTTSSADNFLLREIKRDSMGHIYQNSYVNIYTLFSATSPITYNSSNGTMGLNYSTANLTLSGSTHLNTIQDIHTGSSPLFKQLKLKLVGNHTQSIMSVDTYGQFYFNNSAKFNNYIKILNSSSKGIKQYIDTNNNVIFSLI